MADSILNTATFATASMKPAAAGGENIDAIWGRNIADNSGYLFYKKTKAFEHHSFVPTVSANDSMMGTHHATSYLVHRTEYPYLVGSYALKGTCFGGGVLGSCRGTLALNGVVVWGTLHNLSGAGAFTASGSFVYNKSALTHASEYQIVASNMHQAGDGYTTLDLSVWESATDPG